jgi:hypothetical protein
LLRLTEGEFRGRRQLLASAKGLRQLTAAQGNPCPDDESIGQGDYCLPTAISRRFVFLVLKVAEDAVGGNAAALIEVRRAEFHKTCAMLRATKFIILIPMAMFFLHSRGEFHLQSHAGLGKSPNSPSSPFRMKERLCSLVITGGAP